MDPYWVAQQPWPTSKGSADTIAGDSPQPMTNAEVGRALGIYGVALVNCARWLERGTSPVRSAICCARKGLCNRRLTEDLGGQSDRGTHQGGLLRGALSVLISRRTTVQRAGPVLGRRAGRSPPLQSGLLAGAMRCTRLAPSCTTHR